jgi:hypothetical protein
MWKGLWGCLKSASPFSKLPRSTHWKNQVKIPIAAAIFHNLIRSLHGDEDWLDHQPNNIDPSNFVALPSGDQMSDPGTTQGNALRDTIAQEMWAQYQ